MERILWRGVHPHGFVCGLLMSIIAYGLWGRDIPWSPAGTRLSAMVAAVAAVTGNGAAVRRPARSASARES